MATAKAVAVQELESHPAADLFPLLEGEKYESLKASIAEHGLLNPIVLCDGKILDGRNRHRACLETNREPRFETYTGDSPTAHAWALNGERRHMTPSKLMAISVKMLPALEAEAKKRQQTSGKDYGRGKPEKVTANLQEPNETGEAAEQAAKITGVSARSVYLAKKIKEQDPELFAQVEAGDITVNKASKILADRETPRVDAPEPAPDPRTRKKAKSRGVALGYAHQAIAYLGRIPVDDGLRDEAFDEVIRWIEFNR